MKGRKWYSLKKELRPFITGKSMYILISFKHIAYIKTVTKTN